MGSRELTDLDQVLDHMPSLRPLPWVWVHDPRSKQTKLPRHLAEPVKLWNSSIRLTLLAMVMRPSLGWELASAADAWAAGSRKRLKPGRLPGGAVA